ncbi:tetratricopeptide repeat protein [Gimesia alba]|nr:tetratricopeptide repeat protein [Gimesia alba]
MLLLLFLVSFGGTDRATQASQKQPAPAQRKLVYLDFQKFDSQYNTRAPSLLTRELFRQAFLVAARDELGYRTRDVSLGDQIPGKDTKGDLVFNVHLVMDRRRKIEVRIFKQEGDTETLIEKRKLKMTNLTPVSEVVAFTEELSRTWFKDLLQKAGYAPQELQAPSTELSRLHALFIKPNELNYRDQFSRLNELHQSIAEEGENPERLALLAQSYALYGTLTEQYWCLIPLATKARALLYAERLHQKCPQTVFALSYRALVRTLVGLEQNALDDIQKLSDPEVEQTPRPIWLPIIEAYCLHDADRLSGNKFASQNELLWRYLNLLQATYYGTTTEQNAVVDAFMKLVPDSARAFYTRPKTIGYRQSEKMIETENIRFINSAFSYFEEQNALRMLPERTGSQLKNLIESRNKIVSDLLTQAVKPDQETEPSLALFANSMKELTFLQATDLMIRLRQMQGVKADVPLQIFLTSVPNHPFKKYLESFAWENGVATEAFQELRFVPDEYVVPAAYPIFLRDRKLNLIDKPLESIWREYVKNASHVISELAYSIDYALPEVQKGAWVPYLRPVSPHSPYTAMREIGFKFEQNQDRIPHLLKKYEDSYLLLHAIASQYLVRFDYPHAEWVFKRMYRSDPSYETIYPLIQLAQLQNKSKQELRLRQEALGIPNTLMRRCRQEHDLAEYYLRQGDYEAALPHAERATKSNSGWAMRMQALCHELLGDLDTALEIRQRESKRYQQWYIFHAWCRSRGLEPPEQNRTALKPALEYYAKVPLPSNRHLISDQLVYEQLSAVAVVLYLENQLKTALEVMQYASEEYDYVGETFPAVLAALIADELGLNQERDKSLSRAIEIEYKSRGKEYYLPQLNQILLIKQILTEDNTPELSPTLIDWYLQELPDQRVRSNYLYLIGKALLQKKQTELGSRYLKLAAASPLQTLSTSRMAAYTLLKLKIEKDPYHENMFDADTDQMLRLVDGAYAYQYYKKRELELVNLNRAVQLFPEASLPYLRRAEYYAAQKKRDQADQDFAKAMELTPQVPELWMSRGKFYQSTGQDQAAVEDYRQVLERDPESFLAHQKLALLLAASPDDQVRDGKQALQHAQQAAKLLPQQKSTNLALIAIAYAELKQFDKAKQYNRDAIKSQKHFRIKRLLEKREKLFVTRKPYRLKKRS